jgi:dTDP-4-dehydrorhamnose reductase
MPVKKILLTGAHGQLGREMIDWVPNFNFKLQAYTHNQFNITCLKQVKQKIAKIKPDYILNAAAYTAVDQAEVEQESAFAVNATGVKYLAHVAREFDIPLLHISTDYVFDGRKKTAYVEEDIAQPLSIYGESKLAGEVFLREIWYKHIILRVSWIFGAYGNNFVKTVIKLAKDRSELRIVSDQVGSPTYTGDIAKTLLKIIQCLSKGQTDWGTYHYTGTPTTNWYEFAKQIVSKAKIRHNLVLKDILPISALEYPSIARRPYNSALACSKISRVFNVKPSDWNEGLMKMLNNLCSQQLDFCQGAAKTKQPECINIHEDCNPRDTQTMSSAKNIL